MLLKTKSRRINYYVVFKKGRDKRVYLSTCIAYVIEKPAKPVDSESLCKTQKRAIKKTTEELLTSVKIHNHLKWSCMITVIHIEEFPKYGILHFLLERNHYSYVCSISKI